MTPEYTEKISKRLWGPSHEGHSAGVTYGLAGRADQFMALETSVSSGAIPTASSSIAWPSSPGFVKVIVLDLSDVSLGGEPYKAPCGEEPDRTDWLWLG